MYTHTGRLEDSETKIVIELIINITDGSKVLGYVLCRMMKFHSALPGESFIILTTIFAVLIPKFAPISGIINHIQTNKCMYNVCIVYTCTQVLSPGASLVHVEGPCQSNIHIQCAVCVYIHVINDAQPHTTASPSWWWQLYLQILIYMYSTAYCTTQW